jgi:hypothetical protein
MLKNHQLRVMQTAHCLRRSGLSTRPHRPHWTGSSLSWCKRLWRHYRAHPAFLWAQRGYAGLEFTKDGALKGMIRKSKTDQYGRGPLVFGSGRSAQLLRGWFRKKPKGIEAIFCAINHGQCLDRPICNRNVNEIIKKSVVKVKRCERPSDLEVSGHSLRVGAAQELLIKGYDLAAIMRAGGWSNSEIVSTYLRFSQHNIWN